MHCTVGLFPGDRTEIFDFSVHPCNVVHKITFVGVKERRQSGGRWRKLYNEDLYSLSDIKMKMLRRNCWSRLGEIINECNFGGKTPGKGEL